MNFRAALGGAWSLRRWALIALAIHLIAACLSAGFYHPDEQFQVLEFVAMKLGRGVAGTMPIEYGLAARSWLQPGIFFLVARALEGIGLSDPFAQATVFRILSALLGWAATVAIAAAALPRLKTELERRALLVLSALLWYLPALHARTSSENWGGAVFFIGFATTLLGGQRARVFAAAGALFGLAFALRFQTAFFSIGAFSWWLLVGRARPKPLWAMVTSGLAVLAVSALIDRWGYGYWTSPAWNYFRHTIVEGHVNDTDTAPLWDFLRMSVTETWPALGPLLFLSFLVACVRRPRDPFVWCGIPFFVVHHLIAHKELRFLFPLAHAGPLWLAIAAPLVRPSLARVLLAYNVLALSVQSCVPANPRIGLWRAIARSGTRLVYYRGTDDPYSVQGLISRFYRPPGLVTLPAPTDSELAREPESFDFYYLWEKGEPGPALLQARRCDPVGSELPVFIEERLPRRSFPNIRDWQLLRCDQPKK